MLISLAGKQNIYEYNAENEGDIVNSRSEYFHVFRGRVVATGETVIIKKVIDSSIITGGNHIEIVSQILHQINNLHDCIGTTLDVIEHNNTVYIVREFVRGVNLHTICFDPDYPHLRHPIFLLNIASKVCEILDVVHTHGIIHRNIKPSNIIVECDDLGQIDMFATNIKIVDFENAQVSGHSIFAFPKVPISLVYSPPEIVLKHYDVVNESSDLYCVGIIIYETIARIPAFESDKKDLILHMQVSFPLKKKWNIPLPLFLIIQRATHKQIFKIPPSRYAYNDVKTMLANATRHRYQSAKDMKSAIDSFIQTKVSKKTKENTSSFITKISKKIFNK